MNEDTDPAGGARRTALWAGAAVVAGIAVIWAGSVLGLWFLPFAVGAVAGLAGRRTRLRGRTAAAVGCLAALGGWGLPLAGRAMTGEPVGATAHAVAALAGLPPLAALTVAATLFIAVSQGLCGAWLGWTLARP